MARRPNRINGQWETPEPLTWDYVRVELLMDIRAELQQLNSLLACPNFMGIPRDLRSMKRELAKLRKLAEGKK